MPKRRSVDPDKLIKMVREGTSSAEIMKKMGFKNSTQLKVAYANALIEAGEVPGIAGGRGGKKADNSMAVKVGKRGSIIIPADLVSEMGIESDAKFTIRKSKSGLALKAA